MKEKPTGLSGVNDLGMNLTPPPRHTMEEFKKDVERLHQIMLKDTGEYLTFDQNDWNKAKHCFWYKKKKKIVNDAGITIEEYIGLNPRKRKKNIINDLDFRRRNYRP